MALTSDERKKLCEERDSLSSRTSLISAKKGGGKTQSQKKESLAMEDIALDLGKNKTQMCVRNANAEIVAEKHRRQLRLKKSSPQEKHHGVGRNMQ
jgi:hypothetical protein